MFLLSCRGSLRFSVGFVQPGYMLYDRVLRPAEVGVTEALNSEADQAPEA